MVGDAVYVGQLRAKAGLPERGFGFYVCPRN